MFLVPSHLRATIHSILTASPLDGPHTALLTSTQGQIYVSGSTYDPDWAEDLERPDPLEATAITQADEADETDDEDGDVEPDLSMPEWRRTLRGMANREWKEHVDAGGKDTDRLRLQCDVSRCFFALRTLLDLRYAFVDREDPLRPALRTVTPIPIPRLTTSTATRR